MTGSSTRTHLRTQVRSTLALVTFSLGLSACSMLNRKAEGGAVGAGTGAAVGAVIGNQIGPTVRGEMEPVQSNATEAGKQANRRVEVAIFANAAARKQGS